MSHRSCLTSLRIDMQSNQYCGRILLAEYSDMDMVPPTAFCACSTLAMR